MIYHGVDAATKKVPLSPQSYFHKEWICFVSSIEKHFVHIFMKAGWYKLEKYFVNGWRTLHRQLAIPKRVEKLLHNLSMKILQPNLFLLNHLLQPLCLCTCVCLCLRQSKLWSFLIYRKCLLSSLRRSRILDSFRTPEKHRIIYFGEGTLFAYTC